MAILTMEQYNRAVKAKKDGDMEMHAQVMNEEYGVDSTIIDVEVEDTVELDFDLVENEKSAGLSSTEVAEKYGVTVQKVNAIVRKGA